MYIELIKFEKKISKLKNKHLEFMTEESFIEIQLFKNLRNMNLCSTFFKKLKKKKLVKVNLWIAIVLQSRQFCKIIKPAWLEIKWLKMIILLEKKNQILQNIPYNYIEIAYILFKKANEILEFPNQVLNLIEKIFAIRFLKIWVSLHKISEKTKAIKLEKISLSELNSIKNIVKIILKLQKFFSFY